MRRKKKTKGPGEQKEGHGHLHGATAGCYQAVESAQTAWLHVAGFRWEVQGGTLAIFNDTIMNLVQCFLTPLNSIGFSLFSNLVLILVMLWLSDYRRVLCKMLTVHFFQVLSFNSSKIQLPIFRYASLRHVRHVCIFTTSHLAGRHGSLSTRNWSTRPMIWSPKESRRTDCLLKVMYLGPWTLNWTKLIQPGSWVESLHSTRPRTQVELT